MKPLRRRLIIALIATTVVLAGVAGVGLYGLLQGPISSTPAQTSESSITATARPSVVMPLRPLPRTDSPVEYADAVARRLFLWSTTSGHTLEEYESVISEDADPTRAETSGLVNDLTTYFPTDAQWQQLRGYDTAETVTIQRADIPATWAPAAASDPSAAPPGTTAVTIVAVRHRTGSWYGQPTATADPVSFTVFVACQPLFPRCHILRLSGVNTPLK